MGVGLSNSLTPILLFPLRNTDMTLNHINILNKATLLAMLLLLSVGAMADGVLPKDAIKATVQQTVKNAQNTDEVKNLEAALLALYSKSNNQITRHSFTCQFDQNGNFYMTKDESNTYVSELPMKYSSDMVVEFSTTDDTYQVDNSKDNKRIVNFTPDGYATIYSAFQIELNTSDLAADISFYAPTYDEGNSVLKLINDNKVTGTLPPSTGIIVQKKKNLRQSDNMNLEQPDTIQLRYTATYNDPNLIVIENNPLYDKESNNRFTGTIIKEPVTDYCNQYTMYTLDYWENPTPTGPAYSAFFEFVGDSGNTSTGEVSGNTIPCRALLLIEKPKQGTAKKVVPFSDDPTGIDDIQMDNNVKEGPRYNLSGQRVNKNAKGIIIVGGKKYINI